MIKALCSSGKTIGTGLAVEIDISEMTDSNQGVRARDYVRTAATLSKFPHLPYF